MDRRVKPGGDTVFGDGASVILEVRGSAFAAIPLPLARSAGNTRVSGVIALS
jgi:hypothetical protein